MPVASPDQYLEMLDRAKKQGFAYPAINVSSSQTLNAALAGLAEAGSDGIIQVTTGGGDYWSGPTIKNMASGAAAMAAFAREVAKNYGITIALHTDHCAKDQLDKLVRPLIAISQERVKAGQDPLFNSHMWDGSAVPMAENLQIAQEMLKLTNGIGAVLEIEVGVVGGEEDGVEGGMGEHLYTTPEDGLLTAEALGLGENGRYMAALTFGNVHGVYKPGNVKLRPELLKQIQDEVGAKYGKQMPFDLVFHGGSGSTEQEISDAVKYGVIKMNIDTDMQWAFWEGVLKYYQKNEAYLQAQLGNPDGADKPNKKYYDPRKWLRDGELTFIKRLEQSFADLNNINTLN